MASHRSPHDHSNAWNAGGEAKVADNNSHPMPGQLKNWTNGPNLGAVGAHDGTMATYVSTATNQLGNNAYAAAQYDLLRALQAEAVAAVNTANSTGNRLDQERALALRRQNVKRIAAHNIAVMKRRTGASGFEHNEVVDLDSD
jgi:hypothetical protein